MDQTPEVPQTNSGLKLTSYRDLKDKMVGAPGTPEREAFDAQSRAEILAVKQERIQQIEAQLAQYGTVGEFYLDLPGVLTTSIAPGYDETAQVDYLYRHPGGLTRLFDDNDAGHELSEQDGYVLEQILAGVKTTQNPGGYDQLDRAVDNLDYADNLPEDPA